jgi:cytochrome bd ubiquinol oxidase subunit I
LHFGSLVGLGLVVLAISRFGNGLRWRGGWRRRTGFLWCAILAFPAGFVAVLSGWFTAEVGRQVVRGLLRSPDAMTPTVTGPQVLATLIGYVVVYTVIFVFGTHYTSMRPMAAAGPAATATATT